MGGWYKFSKPFIETLLLRNIQLLINIFHTFNSGRKWSREYEAGSEEVHNTKILNNYECDDTLLNVTIDDIDDDAAVGDNTDNEDDQDNPTLKRLWKHENCSGSLDWLWIVNKRSDVKNICRKSITAFYCCNKNHKTSKTNIHFFVPT